jgi:hypothetical protein
MIGAPLTEEDRLAMRRIEDMADLLEKVEGVPLDQIEGLVDLIEDSDTDGDLIEPLDDDE